MMEDGDYVFSPIPMKGIEEVLARVKIRVLSFIYYLLIGEKLEQKMGPHDTIPSFGINF